MINKQGINQIRSRFIELKMLDQDQKLKQGHKKAISPLLQAFKKTHYYNLDQREGQKPSKQNVVSHKKEIQNIDTQSDIAKELAKLKPYLFLNEIPPTSEELEELKARQLSKENYKMMCELLTIENQKLCQILQEQSYMDEEQKSSNHFKRNTKEEEGWIFQIFYRTGATFEDANKQTFVACYAVMTEQVQIYESLDFRHLMGKVEPAIINYVRYTESGSYEVIQIQQQNAKIVEIGFLNSIKMNLFDRMLFLQKNMSRSSSSRLFQNQLLRNIYENY